MYFYIKLYCIATRCNRNGGIYLSETVTHTPKTLANQWHCRVDKVNKLLGILINSGLLEMINDVIYIADWQETQNSDRLEEIRNKNRERQRRFREKRALDSYPTTKNSALDVTLRNNTDIDIEKEIELDLEVEVETEKDKELIEEVVTAYNATATPKINFLSKSQRDSVLKLIKEFGMERTHYCFDEAAKSEFLNGKNKQGWKANFDWLIKPENMAKVINGNYSNVYQKESEQTEDPSFDLDEFVTAALKRGFDDNR